MRIPLLKHVLTCLFAISFVCSASSQVVYSENFDSEGIKNWKVVDNNSDEKTWGIDDQSWDNRGNVAVYSYHSTNKADDYLISPAIRVEAGEYMLSFEVAGGNYIEAMDVFYGNSSDIPSLKNQIIDLPEIDEGYKAIHSIISFDKAQTIYIAFHAKSDPDKYKLCIDNIELTKSSGLDLAVTEVVSPVTGSDLGTKETVKVKVSNNGTKVVESFPISYTMDDNTPVNETCTMKIEPGETIEYSFAATIDVSRVGRYKLTVKTSLEKDDIPANDAIEYTFKHTGIAEAPFILGFEPEDNIETIKVFNQNNDTGEWKHVTNESWSMFARTGSGCMTYSYDKNNAADDWFIIEPVKLEPGFYAVKFWYSGMGDHKEKFKVAYGTAQTPDAMTNEVVEYNPFITKEYLESANVVEIKESGLYYFGFYAFSNKDENVICIDDFSITPITKTMTDIEVNNLAPNLLGYMSEIVEKSVTYDVVNNGITNLSNVKVKVKFDESVVHEFTTDISAQQTLTMKEDDLFKDVKTGTHKIGVEVEVEGDTDLSNNVCTKEVKVVSNPVKVWDAEDGKIPEDFTLRVDDSGTVNGLLSDLFPNNEAWSIVGISQHPLYGKKMFCSASYLDNATQADRWMILPKIRVNGPNADLMWAAASSDGRFPETYEVRVSEVLVPSYYFSTVANVIGEVDGEKHVAVRGVDLSKYEGKEIYIAFELRSRNSYFLSVDNIALYGDIQLVSSSIEGTDKDEQRLIVINDNTLLVNSDSVQNISIYSVDGALVKQVGGRDSMDLSDLNHGVYIAKVVSDKGTDVRKFIKK